VESENVFEIAHVVNWLNAVPASRKAAFSQILCREMSSSEIALRKITRVEASSLPTLRKNREGWATQVSLLADAELSNDRLIPLGIVSFEVVQ